MEQIIIDDFNEVHGGKYTYPRLNYNGAKGKITATCAVHGDFEVTVRAHKYRAQGCLKCKAYGAQSIVSTFISRAVEVHGDKYDYSKVDIVDMTSNAVISCGIHGDFEQFTRYHLSGSGCPRCRGWDWGLPSSIYIMKSGSLIKIGTSRDTSRRIREIGNPTSTDIEVVTEWSFGSSHQACKIEKLIHERLSGFNAGLSGFDGATEWFDTTPEYAIPIIEKIISQRALN